MTIYRVVRPNLLINFNDAYTNRKLNRIKIDLYPYTLPLKSNVIFTK
jgi:hypothetical protein